MKPPRLLLHGEWIETGAWLPVADPYTGREIARVPLGDAATIDRAIDSAQRAFQDARFTAPHVRAARLHAVARGIEARKAQFVETIVSEAGKPVIYAEAEVARAVITFSAAAEEARRQHGEVLDMDAFATGAGHIGFTRRFPIGVIAGITPFNFPLNLVAHKVAPAIATNNCIIIKPAPKCPLTALLLGEVLAEAEIPAGQLNIVTCANENVAHLVTDDRVAMLSFTGSPAVGWPLKAQAGKKKVVLELGGNAAAVVHADADLNAAVPLIAAGAFGYAGQSCISVQRILVHETIYEAFREIFIAHVKEKIRAGDPRDRGTVIGPMISPDAATRVRGHIASALAAGARFALNSTGEGAMLGPVILEDVPPNETANTTELFAPVATLQRYADFDEALQTVNNSAFGLQAGIFTRDIAVALRAHERLDVGAVLVNQVPTFRVENMPYGGIKDSGFGREGLRYAMEDMTEIRALIIRQ
jgi:acyl-CoA reductase-like NAD-dependent aldehyde dehydrogenase